MVVARRTSGDRGGGGTEGLLRLLKRERVRQDRV